MGASFSKQDSDWLPTIIKQGDLSEGDKTALMAAFDSQTNFDIVNIKEKMQKEKHAKRVCLYKMILYPFERVVSRVIFGSKGLEEKKALHKIHKAYYKNKISYTEYQKRLANFYKDVSIMIRS